MSKTVIDFEICSMVYLYSVELISVNAVEFATLKSGHQGTIKVDSKLDVFWKKIDELDIWSWKKKYETFPEPPTCGIDWHLKLRNNNGKSKYSKGYETFPDNFNDLMIAFDDLVGNKYSEDNRFVNYGEDEEE